MNNSTISFNIGTINEYTFEIRYKPNSKILDYRGELAESLASMFNLPHWRITDNRIDVHDDDKLEDANERGFVSFRNAGCVIRNSTTYNHFFDKSKTILKFLFDRNNIFNKTIMIERMGVRTKFGSEFVGTFQALLDLYLNKYLVPNDSISTIFDAEMIDFGVNLNFKSKSDDFEMATMTGPMDSEQLKKFLPFVEDPPKNVLYFEIDSFIQPKEELDYFKLEGILAKLIRNNWSINNKIVKHIAGD